MSKFIDKINVPNEINENEADLYHVVIIEAGFNQAKLEAEYKARVQTYDTRSWLAVKDKLAQIGHTNVFIVHDPTIKAKPEPKAGAKAKAKTGAKNKANAGAGAGEPTETPKEKRDKLIARAKELGYTGALNVKNAQFEEFIKNAETNGAGADNNAGNDTGENAGAGEPTVTDNENDNNGGDAGDSEE